MLVIIIVSFDIVQMSSLPRVMLVLVACWWWVLTYAIQNLDYYDFVGSDVMAILTVRVTVTIKGHSNEDNLSN